MPVRSQVEPPVTLAETPELPSRSRGRTRAEHRLLGLLFRSPGVGCAVADRTGVTAASFTDAAHRILFTAVADRPVYLSPVERANEAKALLVEHGLWCDAEPPAAGQWSPVTLADLLVPDGPCPPDVDEQVENLARELLVGSKGESWTL